MQKDCLAMSNHPLVSLVKQTLSWIEQEYPPGSKISCSEDVARRLNQQNNSKPVALPQINEMPQIRQVLSKIAPHFKLRSHPLDPLPPPLFGKDVSVVILALEEDRFLTHVAQAISALLAPCQIVQAPSWDRLKDVSSQLKLILGPPIAKWKRHKIASHFTYHPTTHQSTLLDCLYLELQPTESYLKQSQLKRNLWKSLVSHLSS